MLRWGVVGAIVLRAAFIVAGAALLKRFHWVIFIFGGLLVLSGSKIAVILHDEVQPDRNPLSRSARRFVPIMSGYRGEVTIWASMAVICNRRHGSVLASVRMSSGVPAEIQPAAA